MNSQAIICASKAYSFAHKAVLQQTEDGSIK